MSWYEIAEANELAVGQMKADKIADEKVVLYHLEDGYYATASSCTHIFANLAKGKIVDGCKIQCPLHRARFDIRSGEVVDWANFPPGIQVLNFARSEKDLKTYGVKVESDKIYIDI